MKPDEFEKNLMAQPMRKVPDAWREEILAAARAERGRRDVQVGAPTLQTRWWRELLWPCPHAWAGVACVWLVILAMHVASREDRETGLAVNPPVPAPGFERALVEQRRLLAEFLDPPRIETEPAKQNRIGPRSDRRRFGALA